MIKRLQAIWMELFLVMDHKVAPGDMKATMRHMRCGNPFMTLTGRNFKGAMEELKETDIADYIVGSGRKCGIKSNRSSAAPLSMELCEEIYENLKEFPVSIIFSSGDYDYRIGTKKKSKSF